MEFKAEVVLVEPEIPQNTGNIARTCAALGCALHLIDPLGFSLRDRFLRRAGIDYWHLVEIKRYPDIDAFFEANKEGQYFFFSSRAQKGFHQAEFKNRVYLIFGKESTGLSPSIVEKYSADCYRIPMKPGIRSINLASAAAVVLYEAFRQNGLPGI
jgi:tRNA (cytidine/uridine-2'-O-)-methyltransferase